MDTGSGRSPDPGVVRAREAAPSPHRTEPETPQALTDADAAGERARGEPGEERPAPVTPAPPAIAGPDVNDVDHLEETVGPVLGVPVDPAAPRR